MAQLLIAIAMCYILIKIPFWILGSLRNGRRSFLGSMVRGFITYKTFGLIRGASSAIGRPSGAGEDRSSTSGETAPDPYSSVHTGAGGQLLLPLGRLARTRRPTRTTNTPTPPSTRTSVTRGRQAALWTRDGKPSRSALPPPLGPGAVPTSTEPGQQHMLPIHTRHHPDATGRHTLRDDSTPPNTAATPGPNQAALFTRTGRPNPTARPQAPGQPGMRPATIPPGGQYHLPLIGGTPTPSTPPPAAAPAPPPAAPTRGSGQRPLFTSSGEVAPHARPPRPRRRKPPELPAYKGIRPDKHGQYALPLDLPTTPRKPRTKPGAQQSSKPPRTSAPKPPKSASKPASAAPPVRASEPVEPELPLTWPEGHRPPRSTR
ncbi:hypothetical protein [Saccharopolyspora sp. NPDC049357]|uniref:hypothetical protein n=1 Tax=Saccharopolyspora sp. NPDC049357 TaxID=3154507 RepID=UPI0034472DD5